VEVRDGDPARYGGKGVRRVVGHVNEEIWQALAGRTFADLAELDRVLVELDGTPTKARLARTRSSGCRWAAARAFAALAGEPLWPYLTPAGVRYGCRCRTSTWSTAGRTHRTRWTFRSS
jgi:enolase